MTDVRAGGEDTKGYPVELVLAQAGLETGFGASLNNWNFANIRAETSAQHVYVSNAFEDYTSKPAAEAAIKLNSGLGTISPHASGAYKFRVTYPRAAIPGARFASYPSAEEGLKKVLEQSIKTSKKGESTSIAQAADALQGYLTDKEKDGNRVTLKEAAQIYQKNLGNFAQTAPADYVRSLMIHVVSMNPSRDPAFYQQLVNFWQKQIAAKAAEKKAKE